MTLEQIIALFQSVEKGEEGQRIGFHLHSGIRQATEQHWKTNQNYPPTFSGLLEALRDSEE